MRKAWLWVAAAIVASATIAVAQSRQSGQIACNRTCLQEVADAYVGALVARNPSKAPMANVRFTEQAEQLPLGEGLWKAALSASPTFKIMVPDPVAGQIGFIIMMKAELGPAPPSPSRATPGPAAPPALQADAPKAPVDIELAVRLKVFNRMITEAEHIYARITAPPQLANLQTPRPAFAATVPLAERTQRPLMLLIANSYYDAIVQSDGDAAPFADDCGRRENGMHTAGVGAPPPPPAAKDKGGEGSTGPGGFPLQGCREQLTSRAMSYITSIDLRRVWIADEEKGLVFGLTMFRHPMTEKFVTLLNPDGTTTRRDWNFNPFDFAAAHVFKISGNKIHEIEALGVTLPFNSKNGWSQFVR